MGVDYATLLTKALLQVLASYIMQLFSNSHVFIFISISMHLISIPIPFISNGWSYAHSHGYPMAPMGFNPSPFPCTSLRWRSM